MKLTGIEGKVAVVTGATGVLCSQMVRGLLESGARVALLSRTREKLDSLQQELKQEGFDETLITPCDVLDKDGLVNVRKTVNKHWGPVSILVNGAGGGHPDASTKAEIIDGDLDDISDTIFGVDTEAFSWLFDLNFKGTLLPCLVFGRDMLEARTGNIVNISSMGAQFPLTKQVAYSAAKASIDNFTKWLAIHFAKVNIRVNAIAPGFFSTTQNRFLLFEGDGTTPSPRGDKIIRSTPMARFGEAEELRAIAAFLASDQASFITGSIIPVDGGYSAYGGV